MLGKYSRTLNIDIDTYQCKPLLNQFVKKDSKIRNISWNDELEDFE